MNVNPRLTFRIDSHLSRLIEQARHEPYKVAIRVLKKVRRSIKREIRRRRKHRERFPFSGCFAKASGNPPGGESQKAFYECQTAMWGARPAASESESLTPIGLHFCPPDPGVVRQIMADGGYPVAGAMPQLPEGVTEPPEPVADDDGVLILPAKEQSVQESAVAAFEPPPLAENDPIYSESAVPLDLPMP